MAGQGATTRAIAKKLAENNWNVVYLCVPNTPHINVVPIPIAQGSSKQRYPDILAFKAEKTKLIEIEINLTSNVARDILTRFSEMVTALNNELVWSVWREQIFRDTNQLLPKTFEWQCDLVICSSIRPTATKLVQNLEANLITVTTADTYLLQIP